MDKIIKERLCYDPKIGKVFWTNHPRWPSYKGKEAGNVMQNGYRKIKIDGKQYLTHRIAWLLYYGKWPDGDIDHIDGNPLNNKIKNLRDVSHSVNLQNRKSPQSKNSTKYLGVAKIGNKFRAQIHINKKQIYLGTFDNPIDAHKTYLKAKKEIHT